MIVKCGPDMHFIRSRQGEVVLLCLCTSLFVLSAVILLLFCKEIPMLLKTTLINVEIQNWGMKMHHWLQKWPGFLYRASHSCCQWELFMGSNNLKRSGFFIYCTGTTYFRVIVSLLLDSGMVFVCPLGNPSIINCWCIQCGELLGPILSNISSYYPRSSSQIWKYFNPP